MKILFVCDTDTTLSPLASAMFQSSLPPESSIKVRTAGTLAGNMPRDASWKVQEVAKELNLDLSSHRSRKLSPEVLEGVSLVLCMNEENLWEVKSLLPKDSGVHVALITAFTEQYGVREIGDPLQGEWEFSDVVIWFKKSLRALYNHLDIVPRGFNV